MRWARGFLYFGLCASGSSVVPAAGVAGCVLVAQSSAIVVGDRAVAVAAVEGAWDACWFSGGASAIAFVIISPMPTPRHLALNIMRSSGVSFIRALLSRSGRRTSSWACSVAATAAVGTALLLP